MKLTESEIDRQLDAKCAELKADCRRRAESYGRPQHMLQWEWAAMQNEWIADGERKIDEAFRDIKLLVKDETGAIN